MNNSFFPIYIDLNKKNVLLVGGGKIAYRKITTLLRYNPKITVVTKELKEEKIRELKGVDIIIGELDIVKLDKYFLIVMATDDVTFNEKISKLAIEKNILINNATSKNMMNCRFTNIIETDEYQLAISAYGEPKKSKKLKEKLEKFLIESEKEKTE